MVSPSSLLQSDVQPAQSTPLPVFHGLPLPATLVDADGIVVDINAAFLQYAADLGRSLQREDRVGREIGSIAVDTDTANFIRSFVRQVFDRGGPVSVTALAPRRGNRYAQIDASLIDHDGTPLVLLLRRDVSDVVRPWQRREAVAQVRRAVQAMTSPDDVAMVLTAVRDGLRVCQVPFHGCGVNHIVDGPDPHVRVFAMVGDTARWKREEPHAAAIVRDLRRRGQRVYRADLAAEDTFDEGPHLRRNTQISSVVDVPFSAGTLAINSLEASAFSDDDLLLLDDMAVALSEGFRRMQDLELAVSGRRRAEMLATAIEMVSTRTELQEVFDTACRECLSLMKASACTIFMWDDDEASLVPRSSLGVNRNVYSHQRLRPGESISGQVYTSGASLRMTRQEVEERTTAEAFRRALDAGMPTSGGAAAVPVRAEGKVVGTLAIAEGATSLSKDDLNCLERLGQQIGLAIERDRQLSMMRARALELEQAERASRIAIAQAEVRQVTYKMSEPGDFEGVLDAIDEQLRQLGLEFDLMSLQIFSDDTTDFVSMHPRNSALPERIHEAQWLAIAEGQWPRTEGNEALFPWVRRAWESDRPLAQSRLQDGPLAGRSLVDVPFSHGTLAVNRTNGRDFSDEDLALLMAMRPVLDEAYRRFRDLRALHIEQEALRQQRDRLAESERLLAALQHVATQSLVSLDLDHIIDSLAHGILRAGIFRSLMIALVDHEAGHVEVVRSMQARTDPVSGEHDPADVYTRDTDVLGFRYSLDDTNITAETARTGRLQVLEAQDSRCDARLNDHSWDGKVAYFVPVQHDGRVVAVLATGSTRQDRQEMLRRIEAMDPLLTQIASALDHARLHRELSRELAQQAALHGLREQIWSMQADGDVAPVVKLVRGAVEAAGITCVGCGVNIVRQGDPVRVQFLTLHADGIVSQFMVSTEDPEAKAHGVDELLSYWHDGAVALRRATATEGGGPRSAVQVREELEHIGATTGHSVTTVVDVPFSHGTIALNSDRKDAFTDNDIAFLQRLAHVLTEAFRRAEDLQRLEHSETRFRRISEVSADVLWELVVGADGIPQRVWSSAQPDWPAVPDADWSNFVDPSHAAVYRQYLREAATGRQASAEFPVTFGDGERRWLREVCSPETDADGLTWRYYGATTDITRRKVAEEALAQSEETYRAVFEGALDALFVHDEDNGEIVAVNPAGLNMFGCDHIADFVRQRDSYFVDPEHEPSRLLSFIHRARDQRACVFEWRFRTLDGTDLWTEVSLRRVSVAGTWRVLAAVRDIGARVEAKRLRQDLALRVLRAQEEERRRIARELHDGVNQILSAASARLHLARMSVRDPAEQDESIEQARRYLEDSIVEIRRISRDLRPSMLDDLGLESALHGLVRRFREDHGAVIEFRCGQLPEVNLDISTTVYRIVQEGLTNVIRHSQAQLADLQVAGDGDMLRVDLYDDGQGFDDQATGHGIGMRNMYERAELLGGTLEIKSGRGLGTRLCLRLPLEVP